MQLNDVMVGGHFELASFAKKAEAEASLRSEIKALINRYRFEIMKPAVVLIIGDNDFSNLLATLRLEGFIRIFVVYSSDEAKMAELVSLGIECTKWDDMKVSKPRSYAKSVSSEPGDARKQEPGIDQEHPAELIVEKITANQYIVALHVKHLLEWGALSGTLDKSVVLSFNIGIKKKSQTITISCESPTVKDAASKSLTSLLEKLSSLIKIHPPLRRWHPQHREAIMKSEPLIAQEKLLETTALFYLNENYITVELVSLSNSNCRQFISFLENLNPSEDSIYAPQKLQLTELDLTSIRKSYAVVADLGMQAYKWKSMAPLRLWGFDYQGLFQSGIQAISEIVKLQPQQSCRLPMNTQLQQEKMKHQQLQQFESPNGFLFDQTIARESVSNPQTHFKFKTREAGIFYQAFEGRCRAYIEDISGVAIDKLDNPRAKTTINVMQTTLTITGTPEKMAIAKDYLKTFQSKLTHTQIFFGNVSMEKYKQLHDTKVMCELTSDTLTDPLQEADIVSVRLKPPMNTRGIRRMAFPCDVWITVCGPNDEYVTEIEELLKGLQADFSTRILSISKSSLLNSLICKKKFRQEFVLENKLMGVRLNTSNKKDVNKLTIWANESVFLNPLLMAALQEANSAPQPEEAIKEPEGNSDIGDGKDNDDDDDVSSDCSMRKFLTEGFRDIRLSDLYTADSGMYDHTSDFSHSNANTEETVTTVSDVGLEVTMEEPVAPISTSPSSTDDHDIVGLSSISTAIDESESKYAICDHDDYLDSLTNEWGIGDCSISSKDFFPISPSS